MPETVETITQENIQAPHNRLRDLAEENTVLCKFSQSDPSRKTSFESYFVAYPEHSVVTAEGEDGRLSFVRGKDIAKCSMYGDQVTVFDFDRNSPAFAKIQDDEFHEIGNTLGELTAKRLVVKENHSLAAPKTIALILKLSSPDSSFRFFCGVFETPEERMENLGFHESADFVRYITDKYNTLNIDDLQYIKDHADQILQEYNREKEANKHHFSDTQDLTRTEWKPASKALENNGTEDPER